ncbi:MAG: hypothetical protein V1745_03640 [Patescibacteria group bacterium]
MRRTAPRPSGLSLVEVLLAIAIFVVGVSTFGAMILNAATSERLASERQKARFLAEEGVEAVRSIRDASFDVLGTGTYGLAVTGTVWGLSGTSDVSEGYTRSVQLDCGTMDYCAVTSTVLWEFAPGLTQRVVLSTMLTNWRREFGVGTWAHPYVVATVNIPGNIPALSIDIVKDRLYVSTPGSASGSEFYIFDITNEIDPILLGQLEIGSNVYLDADGFRVYLASDDNPDEVKIVDTTVASSPTILGTVKLTGNSDVMGIAATGSQLHFARQPQGNQATYYIYNVTTATAPVLVGSTFLGSGGNDLALKYGGTPYAYFAAGDNSQELKVVNISNPASLAVGGGYDAAGAEDFHAVTVSGTMLYAGSSIRSSNPEFFILNAAVPLSPSLLGTFEIGGNVIRMFSRRTNDTTIAEQSHLVFAATGSSTSEFIVMNVHDPVNPYIFGQVDLTGDATDIAVATSTAYVTTNDPSSAIVIIQPGP